MRLPGEATAGSGDIVRLTAEGEGSLAVEMSLLPQVGEEEVHEFATVAGSELRFGRRVGGITVDADDVDIELGDGGQLELVAPVALKARNLVLNCGELVVKADHPKADDQIVYIEAAQAMSDAGLRPPDGAARGETPSCLARVEGLSMEPLRIHRRGGPRSTDGGCAASTSPPVHLLPIP